MLGIGFIIAHFVAMQKPQQRKYHSSCNRSVHRGTAHGKQRVKVCKRKTPHLFLMRSFFVPLRGEVEMQSYIHAMTNGKFPSPCGDKLKSEGQNHGRRSRTVSVPLRGEPSQSRLAPCQLPRKGSLSPGNGSCKSSPFGRAGAQRLRGFCGDKLTSGTRTLMTWQRSFCPLAGIS